MKILKLAPKQRLPLEDMLKHPFITKYVPDASKYLIKPKKAFNINLLLLPKMILKLGSLKKYKKYLIEKINMFYLLKKFD